MTCESCKAAELDPLTGLYDADCKSCSARSLAHSPAWAEARMAGRITPWYESALRAVWGDDWEAGHFAVKAWVKRIYAARAKA
jgi:hypothetical protein